MRSAMVRSTTSNSGVPVRVEDLESPMEAPVPFERSSLTTDNAIPAAAAENSDDGAALDPNVLWMYKSSSAQPDIAFPFTFKSARIYPLDEKSPAKKYVTYEMVLDRIQEGVEMQPGTIFRRYTDFLNLYEGLRQNYASLLQGVDFPKKHFTGNFSQDVVVHRMNLFRHFLQKIVNEGELLDSPQFVSFLQDQELERACRLIDERKSEEALPILENLFVLLSKFYMDRSKQVLLVLCRIVAASSHPIPSPEANKWADLALKRFDGVCDADLLSLYVPLIKACVYTYWKTGRDKSSLEAQLDAMKKRGINVKSGPTLSQAIHKLDPRTESC